MGRPWAVVGRLMAVVGISVGMGVGTTLPAPEAVVAADGLARFQDVAPTRLADTRGADCTCTRLDATTIRVQVTGRSSVPGEAVAAALTVTATNTAEPGFATVWPSGTQRRETSTVNWSAGENRANGTIVELGADGSVDVHVDGAADVIVDVTGVFVEVGSSAVSTVGRFEPLAPTRLLDTRGQAGPVPAGSTVGVPLPSSVSSDAVAVAVNVTATGSTAGGYVAAYAAGATLPETSAVNTDGPGQTRAASAIVPVSPGGLELFTSDTTHLIVDVVGFFTGPGAEESPDGLFRAVTPLRMFDTRASSPVTAGGTIEMYADTPAAQSALDQYLAEASALVFNTTVTGNLADGFVTAYPARTNPPETSSINWLGGESVANLTISPISSAGVAFQTSAATHVIVDVTGFFTGVARPAEGAPPASPTPDPPGFAPPTTAVQDAIVAAIVRSSVEADVWALLGGVSMSFLPDSATACTGAVGLATITYMQVNGQVSVVEEELFLAEAFHTLCPNTTVPQSVAAHEVGHILIGRWSVQPGTVAGYMQRRELVDALSPGEEECLAESIGQLLYARNGLIDYTVGYNGAYQGCATAPETRALAEQVVSTTTG